MSYHRWIDEQDPSIDLKSDIAISARTEESPRGTGEPAEPLVGAPANPEIQGLIYRAVNGSTSAFGRIVELHQQYVFAIAFGLLRDQEAARDTAQDTFVKVWRKLGTYDGSAKFTTWLYRITVNQCFDRMKSDRRGSSMLVRLRDKIGASAPAREDPLTILLQSEICKRVMELAAELPAKQRLVFHLRDANDLPMEEIAEIASMSMGTVKANLSLARKRIREQLMREGFLIQELRG